MDGLQVVWPLMVAALVFLLSYILACMANLDGEDANNSDDGIFSAAVRNRFQSGDWSVIIGSTILMGGAGMIGSLLPMVAWINWLAFAMCITAIVWDTKWLASWIDSIPEFVVGTCLLILPYFASAVVAANLEVLGAMQWIMLGAVLVLAVAWGYSFWKGGERDV